MRINYTDVNGHYDGDVRGKNIRTGFGREYFESGVQFEGFFLEGQRRGYGEEYDGDILKYRGEWFNNKKHGYGQEKYDNAEYIGCFAKGCRHGFGVCFFNDGSIYVGEWKWGERHGKGTHIYPDKSRLEGWLKDGKTDGACFFVGNDGTIEKRICEEGKYSSSVKVSLTDRLYNDQSGIYGCFEKNGKTYYGKYRVYEDLDNKIVMCGMALEYTSRDEWGVSTYENDVPQGETVWFEEEIFASFDRSYLVDGKAEGFCITYKGDEVTCQYYTPGDPINAYGIKYAESDYLYVGQLSGYALNGFGLFYSFEDKKLCSVYTDYNEIKQRTHLLTTDDVFGYCYSVEKGSYPGSAIDANDEHFIAGKVDISFDTCKKSLPADKGWFFNRTDGTLSVKSPDGSCGYTSTALGERSYFVGNQSSFSINADGDYTGTQKLGELQEVVKRNGDVLRRYAIDPSNDKGAENEWLVLEINGGMCASVEKGHTQDLIAWVNKVYIGQTVNNSPCGYGEMIFPGFGFTMGEWRGQLNCDNATFFTYEKNVNEPVTVINGVITFPDGKTFNYA